MKILYSHAGYHTHSDKVALVEAPAGVVGEFVLLQDGRQALRGALQTAVSDSSLFPFSRSPALLSADFSSVRSTGWNQLRVTLAGGAYAESGALRISPVIYRGLAKEALLWFGPQRCGTRVEFWHGACHRQDAGMPEGRDASGGWHSGDSWAKRADEAWLAVWACCALDAHVRDFTTVPGESMPHIIYEAAWGGEWLMKLQRKQNARFLSVMLTCCAIDRVWERLRQSQALS